MLLGLCGSFLQVSAVLSMSSERPQKVIYTGNHNDLSRYEASEVLTRAGREGNWWIRNFVLIIWSRSLCLTLEQAP